MYMNSYPIQAAAPPWSPPRRPTACSTVEPPKFASRGGPGDHPEDRGEQPESQDPAEGNPPLQSDDQADGAAEQPQIRFHRLGTGEHGGADVTAAGDDDGRRRPLRR